MLASRALPLACALCAQRCLGRLAGPSLAASIYVGVLSPIKSPLALCMDASPRACRVASVCARKIVPGIKSFANLSRKLGVGCVTEA